MSKQFVNDVVSVTVFVTRWHEGPLPPLEGEVVERQRNRRGLFVNRAVQETPQSAYGCQLQLCIKHLYAAQAATAAKPFRGALGKTRTRRHSPNRSIPQAGGSTALPPLREHIL